MKYRIEDFYDVPPLRVRLIGGTHAGRRMTVPGPLSVALALPPVDHLPWDTLAMAMILGPQIPDPPEVYQYADRVDDGGTRVYVLVR